MPLKEIDMERRGFVKLAAAAGLGVAPLQAQSAAQTATQATAPPTIERANPNQPGRGKVFALITPHLDDGPIFAGGTIAKLLNEGYTGYFIRVSNDEKDSFNATLAETVLAHEHDTAELLRV